MNIPHKHAAVIKAWADGATVQFRTQENQPWMTVPEPKWFPEYQYRVKPETKSYRVVLFKSGGVGVTQNGSGDRSAIWENNADFLRWLTDWVDYE